MPIHPSVPLMDSSFPGGSGGTGGAFGGAAAEGEHKPKIHHTQTSAISTRKIEWKRKPNADGKGATHVRSFHARLNTEALETLDLQINQWLEEHPELEVKHINASIGEWQGKVKEPNLILQVWV